MHLDNTLYYYRDNLQGVTSNIKHSDIDDMLFAMDKMITFIQCHREKEPLRQLAAGVVTNCFNEVRSMTKILHGYYRYSRETKRILRVAAGVCQETGVPVKKVWQMRYSGVDTFFSALRMVL